MIEVAPCPYCQGRGWRRWLRRRLGKLWRGADQGCLMCWGTGRAR